MCLKGWYPSFVTLGYLGGSQNQGPPDMLMALIKADVSGITGFHYDLDVGDDNHSHKQFMLEK